MKRSLLYIVFAGIFLVSCSELVKNRTIKGSVLDATTGKPLSGISVALYGTYNYAANSGDSEYDEVIARGKTDANGHFELHPGKVKHFRRFSLKAIPPGGVVDTSETVWKYLYKNNGNISYDIREFFIPQQISLNPSGIIYFRTRTGDLSCDSIGIESYGQYQTLLNQPYRSTGLFYADPGSRHTFRIWEFRDGRKYLLCKYRVRVTNSYLNSGKYWHDIENIPLFAAK